MKPSGEAGILLKQSELFIHFPSKFAKQYLFYTERCGHYFVDRHYLVSRIKPIRLRFAMFYIVSGEMLAIIGGKEYIVKEHEILILNMRQSHLYAALGDAEIFWLCFDGNCSEIMVDKICRFNHVYTPVRISRAYNALKEILDGFYSQRPLADEVISSSLHFILSDLLSQQRYAVNQKPSAMEQAVLFIEANYYLPITIRDIADMLYLNPSYFCQKFKAEIGVSPKQYLMNTRLNAAKLLLCDTNWSIREISEKVGFQTDTYFSCYFHKRFKETPKDYRKKVLLKAKKIPPTA